jgi:hypothetical protein
MKILVKSDTFISHLGRIVKAGETVEFDLPLVTQVDKLGNPVKDAKTGLVVKAPMVLGRNLEAVEEPAKK